MNIVLFVANVSFAKFDLLTTPWPGIADKSVDLLFGCLVLEHLPSLDAVFGEACRILKPGGSLLVIEFHPFKQLQGNCSSSLIALIYKYLTVY